MAVAFRSDNEVVNGTAGTSVTVSKPSGIVDTGPNAGRDHLIAVIATVGVPTITAPADWVLGGTVPAGTALTLAWYRKLASSEPANWTWTLGASQRNWGWVGAYTGVDPDSPIAGSNDTNASSPSSEVTSDPVTLPPHGHIIKAAAATRAASGTATTWTGAFTERFDGSTNAGAGTDISGTVRSSTATAPEPIDWFIVFTASQLQDSACSWGITLRPYFTGYDGGRVAYTVEAAFGADPDGSPGGWSWTDLTDYVLDVGLEITAGRADVTGRGQPTRVAFGLRNLDGRFSIDNPNSPYWPNLRRNLPIRVRMPYGYTPPTERATAFVSSWRPRWDVSTNAAVVGVEAHGRLRRLTRRRALRSAMFRTRTGLLGAAVSPTAYWPVEDDSGSTRAASALTGVPAMKASGGVSFASDSTLPGSKPLATLPEGAKLTGTMPVYPDTGKWCVTGVFKVPAATTVATHILYIRTTGTARTWTFTLIPGTPDEVGIRAYNSSGTQILANSVVLSGNLPEADFYDQWCHLSLLVEQDGADVDYEFTLWSDTAALSVAGTLASNSHGNATSLTTYTNAETSGLGVGHFAVYTDPTFDVNFDPVVLLADSMSGNKGEEARTRFARLCDEEGIPYNVVADDAFLGSDLTMGPQPDESVVDALQECADLDGGLIHDAGYPVYAPHGGLVLVSRTSRYNATPTLTLDMSAAELGPGFEPEFDDQRLLNDVTATRVGGSSARVVDAASVAVEGVYQTEIVVNAETDGQVDEIAGWQAHVGAANEMRYPRLSVNLRRTPALAQEWFDTRIGSRMQVVNLMDTHPSDVDVFVEGYTERIARTWWSVTPVCSPASPYTVNELDSDTYAKVDTDGSELVASITTGATTFEVATVGTRANGLPAPVWTVDDTEFPFDIKLGGEVATVTDIAPALVTFGAAGTAAHANNANVTPGIPASVAAGNLLLVLAAIRNSGAGIPSTPTGYTRIPVFEVASNVQLFAKIAVGGDTAPTISFGGGVANADTSAQMIRLGGQWYSPNGIAVARASALNESAQNIAYPGLHLDVDNCVVLYLGWKQDDWTSVTSPGTEIGEPSTTTGDDQGIVWAYTIQTTAATIAPGSFTVTGGVSAISRGAVVALRCDKQTFTVTRSVNGIVKAHTAAAAVNLWQPFVLAL